MIIRLLVSFEWITGGEADCMRLVGILHGYVCKLFEIFIQYCLSDGIDSLWYFVIGSMIDDRTCFNTPSLT